jgi:hypothetical protein
MGGPGGASTHFLARTLDEVSTETSLHVPTYDLERVTDLLRAQRLMHVVKA